MGNSKSNQKQSKQAQVMSEEEAKRRRNIVQEILTTEETYEENMKTIVEVFMLPLSTNGIISRDCIRAIFSISEEISNVHQELLKDLKQRINFNSTTPSNPTTTTAWNDNETLIGDIFVRSSELLRMYSQYANNFGNSLSILSQLKTNNQQNSSNSISSNFSAKFNSFLEEQQRNNPRVKGQTIESFLILPIQRIPRYVLLIQDLLKHTPDWHPDKPHLEEALKRLKEIAVGINEKKRESENQAKMILVEENVTGQPTTLVLPHRSFVREGDVMKIDSKNHRKLTHLFLFNDMLLVTVPSLIGSKHKFKMGLPLDKIVIGGSDSSLIFTVCSNANKSECSNNNNINQPIKEEDKKQKQKHKEKEKETQKQESSSTETPKTNKRKDKEKPSSKLNTKSPSPTTSISAMLKRSTSKSPPPNSSTTPKKEKQSKEEEEQQQQQNQKESNKEKEKEKKPKSMMPEGIFRFDFEAQSTEDASDWIKKLQESQTAHVNKLQSWARAVETKGGSSSKKPNNKCSVM